MLVETLNPAQSISQSPAFTHTHFSGPKREPQGEGSGRLLMEGHGPWPSIEPPLNTEGNAQARSFTTLTDVCCLMLQLFVYLSN